MTRLLHLAAAPQRASAESLLPESSPGPEDLGAHEERLGPRPSAAGNSGDVLLGVLEESGLTGCGGGHFPVARKWRTALDAGGGGVLVINAAEGEPASAKDEMLLTTVPHLVLDGVACAVETLGSAAVVLWIHQRSAAARRALALACAQRRGRGSFEPALTQMFAPERYLSGESSAIVRALAGGPALPAFSRLPAAAGGAGGDPVVVQNVETLARIGLLARTGVRSRHRTSLVTVTISTGRTVLELDESTTVHGAVASAGWTGAPPKAVLVGGYGGSWLPWHAAHALPLREDAFRRAGASLGAGVLLPLGEAHCGVWQAARVMSFLAASGARQCGPCRFGLPEIADRLAALAAGRARPDEVRQLGELAALVEGRGACHHPDGAATMVTSALRTFAADVDRHAQGLTCPPPRLGWEGLR